MSRVEVGTFSSGFADFFVAEGAADPARLMIAEADAKVEVERAERERIERQTITVDRAWLLEILRAHIAMIERDGVRAYRQRDGVRYNEAVHEAQRLRDKLAAIGPPP
jgi:hypothetical protein